MVQTDRASFPPVVYPRQYRETVSLENHTKAYRDYPVLSTEERSVLSRESKSFFLVRSLQFSDAVHAGGAGRPKINL